MRPVRRPGTYLTCAACGRMLRIEWPTRSIICSCGQKVVPQPDGK
jgi:DNA-directed RNA polymerase subunit RPC12/RpoP